MPKPFADQLGLHQGDRADLIDRQGELVITLRNRKDRLETMLAQVTEENLHREIRTATSVGEEVIDP